MVEQAIAQRWRGCAGSTPRKEAALAARYDPLGVRAKPALSAPPARYMGPMLLVLALYAAAASLLVYERDVGTAVTVVAADAGVDPESLRPVRLAELPLPAGPVALGVDQPPGCAGAPALNAQVRERVSRAEGRVAYQQWGEAARDLDGAALLLPCLSEAAEASLLSRLYFLRGYVAWQERDARLADESFRSALAFSPGLAWDGKLSPEAKPRFDAVAASAPAMGALGLGPGFDLGTVWIDGRVGQAVEGRLELPAGLHLVQGLGGVTRTVEVRVGPGQRVDVVDPAVLQGTSLTRLEDPAWQPLYAALLRRAAGGEAPVYAWTGARTLRLTDTWEALPQRRLRANPVCAEARRCAGHAMIFTGLGALLGGGTTLAVAVPGATGSVQSPEGETAVEYQERSGRHAAYQRLGLVGGVTGGLGLVVGGVGFVLAADGQPVAVGPLPGGRGLRLTFAW